MSAYDIQKTLFISDLDGTLLDSSQRLTSFTLQTINTLIARGVCFSYATARSIHTARKVTAGLELHQPVICYNGAFIRDGASGELIEARLFDAHTARRILDALLESGIRPIVYQLIDGTEQFAYNSGAIGELTRAFVESRQPDPRDRPVDSDDELLVGRGFYFACIDEGARLAPLYDRFRDEAHCIFSRDVYSKEQWLEILPHGADKAVAVRRVAKMLGCTRTVAFGDNDNDLEMFEAADECYAVENATDRLKDAATGVIGSNVADGVARWLIEHVR